VALGPEVIDLIGSNVIDKMGDLFIIGKVAIVEKKACACIVGVSIDMVETGGIDGRCPPDDSMYFVAVMKKEFGEVRSVLPRDASYQSFFWNNAHSPPLRICKCFVGRSYMGFVFQLVVLKDWSGNPLLSGGGGSGATSP